MESLVQTSPMNSPNSHNHHHHHHDHGCPTLITTNHHIPQTTTNSSSFLINNTTTTQLSEKGSMIKPNKRSMPLLVINYLCLFIGSVSSSLLSKYYFIHKGSSIWVSTWVQCSGFPLLLPFIFIPYYLLHCTQRKPFSHFTPKILVLSILIGLMLGLNNFLFSWGNSYLPVSTSSLLLSSQLVFNLILSVIIVKQKVTFSNLNCVILLTLSSVLLALGSNHDKPHDLTRGKYFLGFFSTIGAGLLFALYLPVMEKIYSKVYCYAMVIEMQLVMEAAATVLATVGMALKGGFREMKVESARVFDKGENVYWVTVWCNVVTWQLCFIGTAGMVFLTSSLTGGICMTALMGMNVLGGVLVYGDSFGGVKVVSTFLCGWGFCSYVYGLYIKARDIREEGGGEGGDGDKEGTHQEIEMDVHKVNDSSV
ncbi:purine permease 4 [Pyrus ussuriensis x Pyrus communis]|uniref:Probable purine permease n=1 Tax=Pyrus ussuriensis x Pyrus communis TaxID=2448454 RepID=A0A5N5IES4_9ROSA|nr:purine permease 4 [Pyrus ussuriensis x Pyrus communis]